ncbi:MAG TPA: TIGR01244 family sulfur transferase [Caulobacteraceae bacterium]
MTDFRRVNERLSVSPQIALADVARAKALGFATIINNRPDGEAPDQPPGAEVAAAATAIGLDYVHIPVSGMPTPQQVEAQREAIAASDGPVLAYCRSGNRCMVTWAVGERLAGRDRDELVKIGADLGYDLARVLPG